MTAQRIDYIYPEIATGVLKNYEAYIPKLLDMIAQEPTRLVQTRLDSLLRAYHSVALYGYALGHPLAQVRQAFIDAAGTWEKVFELRGTEPAFLAYDLTVDLRQPVGQPPRVTFEKAHPDGTKDYSLTNSRRNFLAVCDALIGGQDARAERLAAMAWDPPDARYVYPKSDICTPNDQHLAYAVREFFQEDFVAALAQLKRIRTGRTESSIGHYRELLQALIEQDAESFTGGIELLLAWHERQARLQRNVLKADFYMCTAGLGLVRLALQRGVCAIEQLPEGNVFLPLDLVRPDSEAG